MTRTSCRAWLFALLFALGQWCAVVHATHHQLIGGDQDIACQVCAIGHGAAGPPAPIAAAGTAIAPAAPLPTEPSATPPQRPHYRRPPTRGPPLLLA